MKKKLYRNRHSHLIRGLSLALCLCLIFPSLVGNADTIDETKSQIQQLEEEKQKLNAELDVLREDESKKKEYQEALEEKINNVQTQIDTAIHEINALNDEIRVLEKKLDKAEESIKDTLDAFYARIKALYKSGSMSNISSLETLLNATSLTEYTALSQAMKSFTKHDQQQIDKIKAYQLETQADRTACEEKKQTVADLKLSLEKNRSELDDLQAENAEALAAIGDLKSEKEQAIDGLESKSAEKMAELEELIAAETARREAERKAAEEAERLAQINNSNNNNINNGSDTPDASYTGDFNPCWPIPGVTYVSQHYGNNGHRGIDIAGPYGKPIVAAESGQVLVANNTDSWGDSWGYYVLLYHNSTFTTRYAHLSSMTVSSGQWVTKGQIIGYEGNTGNSTGPHLHFEVYRNGTRVDPWPYIG